MTTERIEVPRLIAADPADIFRLLCDPQGHVAIDSSGHAQWPAATRSAAVGDTFVVHMDREALNDYPLGKYDVTVSITAFEQDREIAWTILGALRPRSATSTATRSSRSTRAPSSPRTTTGPASTRCGGRPPSCAVRGARPLGSWPAPLPGVPRPVSSRPPPAKRGGPAPPPPPRDHHPPLLTCPPPAQCGQPSATSSAARRWRRRRRRARAARGRNRGDPAVLIPTRFLAGSPAGPWPRRGRARCLLGVTVGREGRVVGIVEGAGGRLAIGRSGIKPVGVRRDVRRSRRHLWTVTAGRPGQVGPDLDGPVSRPPVRSSSQPVIVVAGRPRSRRRGRWPGARTSRSAPRQAGGVALVADEDHGLVGAGDLGQAPLTVGVEPPLHVAADHEGPGARRRARAARPGGCRRQAALGPHGGEVGGPGRAARPGKPAGWQSDGARPRPASGRASGTASVAVTGRPAGRVQHVRGAAGPPPSDARAPRPRSRRVAQAAS